MLKSLLFTFSILFCSLAASAFPVDRDEAIRIASHWWGMESRSTGENESAEIRLETVANGYWFHRADEFLLVAADDRLPEVLAYGTAHSQAVMPPALEAILKTPASTSVYPPVGAQWQVVNPLLTTVRHQEAPYNAFCPRYRFEDGTVYEEPCVVGCVATAMEQILTYHRRTYEVQETIKGWETPHYTVGDIPAGSSVDTRLIRDNYDDGTATEEEKDAVARFSYYLGQASGMHWGFASSGAESRKMAEGVERYFGLKYVHYLDAYCYAPAAYWNFIAAELMARRPVYYAGSIMRNGGHAFVLDGIDEDGLFHVNWGYGGDYDGYFRLDVLAHPQPEGNRKDEFVESGFFCNQQAIAVYPDALKDAFVPDSLERKEKDVEIESVFFGKEPLRGCHTPVYLCLHNTAKQALTTSFALLENAPTDTNRVEQAQWLALTGRTLEAGERDTVCVHTKFTRSGNLLFSVTSDGNCILYTAGVQVGEGGTDLIETEMPRIESLTPDEVTFSLHVTNPSDTERAAQNFVYDLLDAETQTDGQIEHFIYLDAGADSLDYVRFRDLRPGHRYTLRVRRRWPIVQTLDFTVPDASALELPTSDDHFREVRWYTLDGRQISGPEMPGVYLKKEGTRFRKIMISTPR